MVTELPALAGWAVTWSYLPPDWYKRGKEEAAIFLCLSDSEANWLIASSILYKAQFVLANFNLLGTVVIY